MECLKPDWRPMRAADLPGVLALAAAVHPDFPEDAEIFAERLALAPQGCHVLAGPAALFGYAIAHPWAGAPPKLNTRLLRLPANADSWFIHDVALRPEARGRGHAAALLGPMLRAAAVAGLRQAVLVAVGGSASVWRRLGFEPVGGPTPGAIPGPDLAGYGAAASLMVRLLR